MHTPDQARELWCPMVRIARREIIEHRDGTMEGYRDELTIVASCNTDALGRNRVPASCTCIAEKCGMWRWSEYKEVKQQAVVPDPLCASGKMLTMVAVKVPVAGYCGLAGRQV